MQKLRFYNAFGIAQISKNSVGVTMFCFSEEGHMHKFARRYIVSPELAIKDPKGFQLPFASIIHEEGEPEFTFSFVKEPKNIDEVIDTSQVIDFLYDAAENLALELGKTKSKIDYPVAH